MEEWAAGVGSRPDFQRSFPTSIPSSTEPSKRKDCLKRCRGIWQFDQQIKKIILVLQQGQVFNLKIQIKNHRIAGIAEYHAVNYVRNLLHVTASSLSESQGHGNEIWQLENQSLTILFIFIKLLHILQNQNTITGLYKVINVQYMRFTKSTIIRQKTLSGAEILPWNLEIKKQLHYFARQLF